jgi:hypothetical protein
MCHERADNFLLRLFYFFLESISQIRQNEQKLGPIAFLQRGPQLQDDPVSRLRPLLRDPYREDRKQRYRLDLNQDLSKFRGRNERRESKWELDSRNVPYGIFSATCEKRANCRLNHRFYI